MSEASWKVRVKEELNALAVKTQALQTFIHTPQSVYGPATQFSKLPIDAQVRLRFQAVLMAAYANVLRERLQFD